MAERSFEFVGRLLLEAVNHRNRQILWPPTKRKLRGRWDKGKLISDERSEDIDKHMPDLVPGMMVEITNTGGRRKLRVFDPLREDAEMMARVKKACKSLLSQDVGPERDSITENPSEDEFKTWLWWAHRLVNMPVLKDDQELQTCGPCLVVKDGKLPTLDEIMSMAGKTRKELFNTIARKPVYEGEQAAAAGR